jgi:undecaprenyl-diphosphatase
MRSTASASVRDAPPLERLRRWDVRLLRLARTCAHNPRAERSVARFSQLGEHAFVWLALGAAGSMFAPTRRPAWRLATATVAGTFALNTAIKYAVRRPRPRLADLPALTGTPTALSFPSAHTSTSVAATLLYGDLGAPRAPLVGLAAGLAYSRLYLGVHYPSDVLAGALLGAALGLPVRVLLRAPHTSAGAR